MTGGSTRISALSLTWDEKSREVSCSHDSSQVSECASRVKGKSKG